jgi:hypothetical protein
VQR